MARDDDELLDENEEEEVDQDEEEESEDDEESEDEESEDEEEEEEAPAASRRASRSRADHSERRQPSGAPKSQAMALLLNVFLGWVGADRFYLGHVGLGVAKLLGTIVAAVLLFVNTESINPDFTPEIAYAAAFLLLVGLVVVLQIHDFLLIGMGRMTDKDGQLLSRSNNGDSSPDNLYQGRAFLLAVFAGFLAQDRFYLRSKTFGYVKVALLVIGLIVFLVGSPRWQGFRDLSVATYFEADEVHQKLHTREIRGGAWGEGETDPMYTELEQLTTKIRPLRRVEGASLGEEKEITRLAEHNKHRIVLKPYPSREEEKEYKAKDKAYWKGVSDELAVPPSKFATAMGYYNVPKEVGAKVNPKGVSYDELPENAPEGGDGGGDAGGKATDDGGVAKEDAAAEETTSTAGDAAPDGPITEETAKPFTVPFADPDYDAVKAKEVYKTQQRMVTGAFGKLGQNPPPVGAIKYISQFPLTSARKDENGEPANTVLYMGLGILGLAALLWLVDILLLGMGKAKDGKGNSLGLDPVFATVFCSECGEIMTVDLMQANMKHLVCRYPECQGYCAAPSAEVVDQLKEHRNTTLNHTVYAVSFFVGVAIVLLGVFFTLWPNALGDVITAEQLQGIDTSRNILFGGGFVLFALTIWQLIVAEGEKPVCEF